jgi:hypothetical protein
MAKLLGGQALFDAAAGDILEHLGLNSSGRNRSWRGPVYSDGTAAELDGSMRKAQDLGHREKTAVGESGAKTDEFPMIRGAWFFMLDFRVAEDSPQVGWSYGHSHMPPAAPNKVRQ